MWDKEESKALSDMVLEIIRINGELMSNNEQRVKPFGLTAAQYQVLGAVGLNKIAISTPQIAKFMGMSRQGVQKQLKILCDKGLMITSANPFHERSPLYSLSESGLEQYSVICEMHKVLINNLADKFAISELKTALTVLRHFHECLLLENDVHHEHDEE
jgi:DNA-binding MarR family transcriptional regulator